MANRFPSDPCSVLSVRRSGLGRILFAFRRPGDAKAASVDERAVKLLRGSRSFDISLGDIESIPVESGLWWGGLRIRHRSGEDRVSGLSVREARNFARAVDGARIHWWRAAFAEQAEALHKADEQRKRLADPPAYIARSEFAEVVLHARKAAGALAVRWPDALSGMPEARTLRYVHGFLKNTERARLKANDRFVAAELARSKAYLDGIEAQPLTDAQRRAVVIDEDRNLVVAAAGSGKTSVIVAKAGWLLHKGHRQPSQLLFLAFARNARAEMEERIRKRLGSEETRGVAVETFHGLGMAIIGEAEGRRPALARAAEDDKVLISLLKEIVEDLVADDAFSQSLLKWFEDHFAPYRSEHEFRSWGEYFNYLRRHEIRSLQGERVKSYEECEIANFLYLHGISYEYERIYEHDTATPKKGPYRPDFFLKDTGIYIEHFGVNAAGNTAPFVDREQYLRDMEWKRQLHREHRTILIETFSSDQEAGVLLDRLADKLRSHGVPFAPIPPGETFAMLKRRGRVDPFIRLLATFLQHFKGNRLVFDEVTRRARGKQESFRVRAFMAVFQPVFERYEELLSRTGQIDFHDMINNATDHVEAGRYRSPFRHILVDEFQDISPGRARLLKALLHQVPESRLFAVGDDWQAIYRFGGSDIAVMRNFEANFGSVKRIDLETTFRCADRIVSVANRFVLENAAQIRKNVQATRRAIRPAVHVGLPAGDRNTLLKESLDRIAVAAGQHQGAVSVLLLGRFRHTRPQNLATLKRQYSGLRLDYSTVHAAKGAEADYVVILDLGSGKYGFPVEIVDDPLLDLVLAESESVANAEERRLLYVAITRARHEVYLLAEGDPPSPFVLELIDGGYDVSVFGRRPERETPCPHCVEGRLKRRGNTRDGIFYGCSNWPYCRHRQRPCPACGKGQVARVDGALQCRDCGQPVTECPECEGWLETRLGRYGRFLGCTNYPACSYTRNIAKRRRNGSRAAEPSVSRRPVKSRPSMRPGSGARNP